MYVKYPGILMVKKPGQVKFSEFNESVHNFIYKKYTTFCNTSILL